MRIVITGATGRVGSQIPQFIDHQAHQCVLALRNPSDKEASDDVESILFDFSLFDFSEPATYESALAGADSLFLMRPPSVNDVDERLKQVVDVAIAANIQKIVYLSVLGAEKNKLLPHRATEDYIKSKDIAYTFLRASFFMQNLSSVHRAEIQENHEIFVPAGNGKTSFIDARDVAAVAAKALTEPGHERTAYALTGAEALNYYEVANTFSEVLGRPITYKKPSLFRFIFRQLRDGTPLAYTLVMSGIYTTARLGIADRLSGDVRDVLMRSPISLRTFIEDYQDCWI